MDKNKALPLASKSFATEYIADAMRNPLYYSGFSVGQDAQRDADLLILERDYVPREQVKRLVKALEEIATGRVVSEKCLLGVVYKELAYAPLFARVEIAQQALAGLGGEVKE